MRGATQGRALQNHQSHQSHSSHDSHSSPPAAAGNIWLRARGYRLHAGAGLTGRAFDEYAYGLTAGGDRAFRPGDSAGALLAGSTLLAGGFIDMGRVTRDFAGAGNTGDTGALSAGLYATWLHDVGWHADLVLKADRYKHRFDALTADARPVHGAYSSDAQGLSLEIGRRLERPAANTVAAYPANAASAAASAADATAAAGWWVEPGVQAAVVWLRGADYRTTPGNQTLDVTVGAARAAQYRAQVRFGKQLRDTRWQPHGKFGVVKTDTAGGALRAAGETFAPDYDGWREEFGLGTAYRINGYSQLYFDYEYGKASNYERPWSLNLGYRRLW
jgi:outer membrane autotransporter protein